MIDGLKDIKDLMKQPKTAIKINGVLKECGFKRLLNNHNFKRDKDYYKELTISINPITNEDYVSGRFVRFLKTKKGCDINDYQRFYRTANNDVYYEFTDESGTDKAKIGRYYKERNLFLFFPNIFQTDLSERIFKKDECLIYLLEMIKDLCKEYKVIEVEGKKVMDLMIENFSVQYKNQIETYENEVKQYLYNIKDFEKKVIEQMRHKRMKENQLKQIKTFQDKGKEKILKEIENIESLKFVKEVKLDVDRIKVFVGKIDINHEKEDYYIGEFVFEITPFRITIENLDTQSKDGEGEDLNFSHPHINGSSKTDICFGERKSKVYEYLADFDLKKLTYFLYLWSKSYNEPDCYHKLTEYWECKKTEETKKEAEENLISIPFSSFSYGGII